MICREYLDNFSMIFLRIYLSKSNFDFYTYTDNSFLLIMNH